MYNKVDERVDIFDKLMKLPVLNNFEAFYKKNKEMLLYLFFGGLTFIVSVASYIVFERTFGVNELIANFVSWVLAVLFAYITNRTWVFQSNVSNGQELFKEMSSFFIGRIATLIVEEIILMIFITYLGFNSILIKIIAQIVVIVSNYVISKLFVF